VAQLKQITFHYQKKLAAVKMEYGSCKGFIKVREGPEKQGTVVSDQWSVRGQDCLTGPKSADSVRLKTDD
jgi:tellurite resistance-related uncharacterized protein